MRSVIGTIIAGLIAYSYGVPTFASAQSRGHGQFANGAPLREVLASWGEPDERIERSVKRELVWNYKGGARVVFKEGKVSSFKTSDSERHEQVKKAAALEVAKQVSSPSTESKDLLRDIAREIPSGADGPAPFEPPSSSDPNLAGLIPNAVPQRAGQPGIAPGVVVPSLEDEDQ